ncbi:MAG: CBS domain-containing protein [Candidatus Omnitrophota bacterium]|nr:MAG: CBS domain-containing protein [Candidatus Omnitrophota bacterium]
MKVKDAMKKDVIKVRRSTSLRALLGIFKDFHSLPLIPVVNGDERLIGIVYSENLLDLLRPRQTKLFRNVPFVEIDKAVFDLEPLPAMGELIITEDIMDTNFVVIGEDDSLADAYKSLQLHKVEKLPVVDKEGRLLGIIGIFDIIWRMFKEKGIV